MANFFTFPSEQMFEAKANELIEADHILNWLELDKTKIYRIKQITPMMSSKYGECWAMHIVDIEENLVKVWGPRKLIHELKESRKSFQIPYIRSLGQEKIGQKIYNQYRLCYQDQESPYSVFESAKTSIGGDMNDIELANATLDL